MNRCNHCGVETPRPCPGGSEAVGENICCDCARSLRDDCHVTRPACACDSTKRPGACPDCSECESLAAVVDCCYYVAWGDLQSAGTHDPSAEPENAVVRMVCGACGYTRTASSEEAAKALTQVPFTSWPSAT